MRDQDRRPTADEIENLIDLVRRDPATHFLALAEAYLNLGRPRDAVQVCTLGLEQAPENWDGRVMLARAHAQLHNWKEAQGELLRVVKVDRSNRAGFALLGEVLLRRLDFERAVPVLQHAQNLDPTSPAILSMLKRARAGQGLDPPPAIPTPVPPRGETSMGMPGPGNANMNPPAAMLATQVPPTAAPNMRTRAMAPSAPPPMGNVPAALPGMATLAVDPRPPDPSMMATQVPPPLRPEAPPMVNRMPVAAHDAGTFDPTAPPPSRGPKQTAPPPLSIEGVRPRVISGAKPQNAAAASLRQSAAVGESYLNDLLTGGLLDVAGVRVPESDFDLRPDRRWGRSTRRAFIFLFVVLVLGAGGGGGWYWWSEKKKTEQVARLQKEISDSFVMADYAGFKDAAEKLKKAIELDHNDLYTYALVVETGGLEALLYGSSPAGADKAFTQVTALTGEVKGAREVMIGRAAVELSRLHTFDKPTAQTKLAAVAKSLDTYLAKHEDDRWVRWLKGRAQIAAGDRKDGRSTIARAADGDEGLVIAKIEHADLLVDDGKLSEAVKFYDEARQKSKDHPLAVLGVSLGRTEAAIDAELALGELNDKFIDGKTPPRVTAYRALARTLGNLYTEDYEKAEDQLKSAVAAADPNRDNPALSLGDARFWARVAWIHVTMGRLKDAEPPATRVKNAVYGVKESADENPLTQLLGAGIAVAQGQGDRALDLATNLKGVRAGLLRAQALIDLGKYADAIKEAEEVLKSAEGSLDAEVLLEQAKMMASAPGAARTEASGKLDTLSHKLKNKRPSHALGQAHLVLGELPAAKEAFEDAVKDNTIDAPNPVAYRTHTGLAMIAFAANDITTTAKHLDEALKMNTGYFPARALQAKVVLKNGEAERALSLLEPLAKEGGANEIDVQLTLAEAMIIRKGATAGDKENAKNILIAIKDKVKPPTEVGRLLALIDPKLPEELGVPVPEAVPPEGAVDPKAPPPKAPAPPKRRGRR